jgi:DNA-binding PadR family transcriptional regulator
MHKRFRPRWGRPDAPHGFPFFGHGPHGRDPEFFFGHRGGPRFEGPSGPPWGGPPFDDDSFGRGPGRRRQRRGDIKFALLELLAERPRHGYELIKALEERFGGFYRPSPGTVYPTLQLLEDEGHLSASEESGKKVYAVTDSGRQLLAERQAEAEHAGGPPWARAPFHEGMVERHELRARLHSLMAAVHQVALHGTSAQRQAAMAQLDAARREIYRMLAEAGEPQ